MHSLEHHTSIHSVPGSNLFLACESHPIQPTLTEIPHTHLLNICLPPAFPLITMAKHSLAHMSPSARRAECQMFRKRSKTCINKANELAAKCSADVYLLLYKDRRYTIYSSSDRSGWPPTDSDVVGKQGSAVYFLH